MFASLINPLFEQDVEGMLSTGCGLKVPLEQQMVNPHQPVEIWTSSSFPAGHRPDTP